MELGAFSALEWLALAEYELLLFAGVFFLIGALDEFAMDAIWLWLRARGKLVTHRISRKDIRHRQLSGPVAMLVPAWRESQVIASTLRHALVAWPQSGLRVYVGCYRNDAATLKAAIEGAGGDGRVRIVVHDTAGPTTKADCLNRLYVAMKQDEARRGMQMRAVLLHDAEDMVDEAALALIDRALDDSEFVQLPVLPMPQKQSRWIGSHYVEEFAESHGKAMVVRNHMGHGIPAAGVGCAFARGILDEMAEQSGTSGPFSEGSLTEDYELGLQVAAVGGKSRFLRVRGTDGRLVATRSFFPTALASAVRQKSRWMHGIAFQGWDRMGWGGSLGEFWMQLRDRRGPLSALVLTAGYLLLVVAAIISALDLAGHDRPWETSWLLYALVTVNLASFVWRAAMRFAFTAREYGFVEGLRAVVRIPVANIIAIMAGRRAIFAYARCLRGEDAAWDKTTHDMHPVLSLQAGAVR